MFNRFSTNGRPIDVCFPQSLQLPPQYFIFGKLTIRVFIHNGFGNSTYILQKLSVAGYIRYLQIESDAALSAISKPSFVRTIISRRLRVSSASLYPVTKIQ